MICNRPIILFQFHKGTIKTNPARLVLVLFLHFNSIKVRLKHERTTGENSPI